MGLDRLDRHRPFLLLLLYGAALLVLAPAVVNGDGVGYLRQVEGTSLAPGHLAYLPLLRVLHHLSAPETPADLILPARLLGVGCALAALALLHDAVRRASGSAPQALFAAALLALSHAFLRAAADVEAYAPATLLVVATLWTLVRYRLAPPRRQLGWALAAGVLAGAQVHLHLTLALVGPSVVVLLFRWGADPGRWRRAILGALAAVPAVLVPWLAAFYARGIASPGAAWAWLRSSDHGIADPHGWVAPLATLWGAARSLVFVPYPYELSSANVAVLLTVIVTVTLTLVAAAAWFLLALLRRRSPARLTGGSFDLVDLAIWALPLALFAVFFYPSDTERWIFIMPAVALYAAPAAGRPARRLLAVVATLNLGIALLPAALDRAPLVQARSAERVLRPDALLVSPGHGWDELVGLGSRRPPRAFPLVYHVGALGGLAPAEALLRRQIRDSLREGRSVFVARLHDRHDPRGFKELAWFGMQREGFARLFTGYNMRPTSVPDLWRIVDGVVTPRAAR